MTHRPSDDSTSEQNCPRKTAQRYNTRLGFALLLVYVALYGSFVLLTVTKPDLMTRRGIGGMNLAFSFGIVLVVSSIALAVVYGWLSRSENANENIAAEMDSVSVRMRHPS